MKVKQLPEDFVVEELTDTVPGTGEFGLYQLKKVGWTTPDALAVIRRRWNLPPQRLSYGGLKDRHAETTQFLTVYRGPTHGLSHQRLDLTYLGQVREPFTPDQIRANRFRLTIRGLIPGQVQAAFERLPGVAEVGVPNYFDDQRFGSVGPDKSFIAEELVNGRFEAALKLAMIGEYEHDRSEEKQIKAILREHWNNWPTCKSQLPKSSQRSIVTYLADHPTDYKGAFSRLKQEITSLYLAAFQSHLWNQMLASWLKKVCASEQLFHLESKLGPLPLPRSLPLEQQAFWASAAFPLPSSRIKPQPGSVWYQVLEPLLSDRGLSLEKLRIRGLEKPYFSKGERQIALKPRELTFSDDGDELNKNTRKLLLNFELPRGAYATMIIKCVLQSQ